MVTVNITVTDEAVQPEIYLGRQGEKQAREIVFDLSALREKYGTGTATLYHQRAKDPAPYLIAETTGTTMTWTVSETDTVYAGIGYCEFRYTFGTEGLSKSTMFATNVKASLSGDVIMPAALQAWYDALIEYIDAGMDGQGITNDIKDALLKIAEKAVYVDDGGQTYYNDLREALYPTVRYSVTNTLSGCTTSNDATTAVSGSSYSAAITANTGYSPTGATVSVTMGGTDITSEAYSNGVISIASVSGAIVINVVAATVVLSSISAAYTQSGAVYETTSLDDLKADLVVTANYSDGTSGTVTAYTLSGTLTVGVSTVTVSYGGMTATFSVTVSEEGDPYLLYQLPATTVFDGSNYIDTAIAPFVSDGNFTLAFDFEWSTDSNQLACVFRCGEPRFVLQGKAQGNWRTYLTSSGSNSHDFTVASGTRAKVVIAHVAGGEFDISVQPEGGTLTHVTKTNWTLATTSNTLYIGANQGNGSQYYLHGTVYDFKIYSRTLTSEEISDYLTFE